MKKKRIIWVDWLKVIAIWMVVVGHFSPGLSKSFIYSFHVPVFFLISGYLYRTSLGFWKKLLNKLIIPYLLICASQYIIKFLIYFINCKSFSGSILNMQPHWWFVNVIIGFHSGKTLGGLFGTEGCSVMWFVYSLIIIWIIEHYCRKVSSIVMILITALIGLYLHISDINHGSGFFNAFLCYPFFRFGIIIFKHNIDSKITIFLNKISISHKFKISLYILFLFCMIIIQYIVSYYNGVSGYVEGEYGRNLILAYFLGLLGSFILFYFCNYCIPDNLNFKIISLLSSSTIIILGFHMFFVNIFDQLLFKDLQLNREIWSYPISFLILVIFIPIIIIVKRCFPRMLGR